MPVTSIMQLLHAFFSARGNIVRIDSCTDDSIRISLTVAIRLIGAPVNCYTPSHYLSQCWPRSLLPYDVTRPQWAGIENSKMDIMMSAKFWLDIQEYRKTYSAYHCFMTCVCLIPPVLFLFLTGANGLIINWSHAKLLWEFPKQPLRVFTDWLWLYY